MSSSSSIPPSNIIKMTHIQNNPPQSSSPPILFLHGLDSSSHTWLRVLKDLEETNKRQGVAIDFRGCGVSKDGDMEDFSSDALVEDIKQFVDTNEYLHGGPDDDEEGKGVDDLIQKQKMKRPFVLVGHSLGGRVAILYAAKYPQDVAALIVEDMDIKNRSVSPISLNTEKVYAFRRDGGVLKGGKAATKEDIVNSLVEVGYPLERVEKWSNEGRIRFLQDDQGDNDRTGKWWSDVNPQFRVLCYKHIFDNNSGEEAWSNIAASSSSYSFPCHLMVADEELTVCDEKSIDTMIEKMEDTSSRFKVHRYPGATHSIHNSARGEFMQDLNNIIQHVEKEESNRQE